MGHIVGLACLLVSAAAAGAPSTDLLQRDPAAVARVATAARVWQQVRFRHPWLLYKEIDLDAGLVTALPKIEAAADRDAMAAALNEMLAGLKDPLTRVVATSTAAPTLRAPGDFVSWRGSTLVLRPAAPGDPSEITPALQKATTVIIDLRGHGLDDLSLWRATVNAAPLVSTLVTFPVPMPPRIEAFHDGYASRALSSVDGYAAALLLTPRIPISPKRTVKPPRIAVVVDSESDIPQEILALCVAGFSDLVSEGPAPELATRDRVAVGDGLTLELRVAEVLASLDPARTVKSPGPDAKGDDALDAAVKLLAGGGYVAKPSVMAIQVPRSAPRDPPEPPGFPDRAHRVLAGVKLWAVLDAFNPYRDLAETPWKDVLSQFLPVLAGAGDSGQYVLALLGMTARVQDSHVGLLRASEPARILAPMSAPFTIQEIEGQPVVTQILQPELAADLLAGDVVVSIDSKPFEDRVAKVSPLISASTPWHHRFLVFRAAAGGAPNSEGVVAVRGASGKVREIHFKRAWPGSPRQQPEAFRLIRDGIGYVDLRLLEPVQVAGMIEKLKDTRAIVFDMRGYPRSTGALIAPWLGSLGNIPFETCTMRGLTGAGRAKFAQTLVPHPGPTYRGRTVMLIDERAISQSEHIALLFEPAGTKFIGSATAGANGDVTSLLLPGDLEVVFTGHDVRHADGRQLQRAGIKPDVEVRPTLAGLRAGRDEVLERALQYLGEKVPVSDRPAP